MVPHRSLPKLDVPTPHRLSKSSLFGRPSQPAVRRYWRAVSQLSALQLVRIRVDQIERRRIVLTQ
jgi:hypothetical protein